MTYKLVQKYKKNVKKRKALKQYRFRKKLVAGGKARSLKHGQHIVMTESKSRLANLWLTLLNQNGVSLKKFGDSDDMIHDLIV